MGDVSGPLEFTLDLDKFARDRHWSWQGLPCLKEGERERSNQSGVMRGNRRKKVMNRCVNV